jgi:hypothetical protein
MEAQPVIGYRLWVIGGMRDAEGKTRADRITGCNILLINKIAAELAFASQARVNSAAKPVRISCRSLGFISRVSCRSALFGQPLNLNPEP